MSFLLLMLYIASEIIEERPPDISKRAWSEMSQRGMSKLADHWHEKILPRHFTIEARAKYRHQLRGFGYQKRKQRAAAAGRGISKGESPVILGGQIDNVVTGAMQTMLRSRSLVRAYPTHVSLTMTGPRYMTMRVFKGDRKEAVNKRWTYGHGQTFHPTAGEQPDKVKEISYVLTSEKEEMAKVLDDSVQADLTNYRERRVSKH